MIDEILFTGQLIQRNLDNQEVVSVLAIKQYFLFALFCKENIELIQQLIGVVDYTEVSKEEKDRFNEEHPEGNLDRFEQ